MAELGLPAFEDGDWNPADELVVATEHLGFVREYLGSRIRRMEHSVWLGLSRLLLSTIDAAAELESAVASTAGALDVKHALAKQAAAITAVVLGDNGDQGSAADDAMATVLADLRALAIVQHGGWMPTIGRNRVVELPGSGALAVTSKTSYGASVAGQIQPASKTSYGGSGVPQPISAELWARPAPRASGPGTGVRVGLVDTKLWPQPWLEGGWVARPSDLVAEGVKLGAVAGHGTYVAGLILSQAPGATIEVRSALDENGQGNTWEVAEAIADLARSDVSVINLSMACYTADGQPPLVLARAVDRVDSDVVVVGAAGNHAGLGRDDSETSEALARFAALPAWPAALDDVVAVGSLDHRGQIAEFSPDRPWVDVTVLGVNLCSSFLPLADLEGEPVEFDEGWAVWSGTSFSAALVSGAIAAGVDPGRLSPSEVLADLLSTASRYGSTGDGLHDGAPRRLALRTAGWSKIPLE